MASVHEQVQQRAGKDEKEGQPAQEMRAMFRDQVEGGDRQEAVERNIRRAEATRPLLLVIHVIGVRFHDGLAGLVTLPNDVGHSPHPEGRRAAAVRQFGKSRFCSRANVGRSQGARL
jgi:hypothetical protein